MLSALLLAIAPLVPSEDVARVLVFTRTMGFRHDSIPAGIAAVREIGMQEGIHVDATEDPAEFNLPNWSDMTQ